MSSHIAFLLQIMTSASRYPLVTLPMPPRLSITPRRISSCVLQTTSTSVSSSYSSLSHPHSLEPSSISPNLSKRTGIRRSRTDLPSFQQDSRYSPPLLLPMHLGGRPRHRGVEGCYRCSRGSQKVFSRWHRDEGSLCDCKPQIPRGGASAMHCDRTSRTLAGGGATRCKVHVDTAAHPVVVPID